MLFSQCIRFLILEMTIQSVAFKGFSLSIAKARHDFLVSFLGINSRKVLLLCLLLISDIGGGGFKSGTGECT